MACVPCDPPGCDTAFSRLVVSRLAAGPTAVAWAPAAGFGAPAPRRAYLEISTDGESGPFRPVAGPVPDSHVLVDPHDRRLSGDRVFYRVRLAWGPAAAGMGLTAPDLFNPAVYSPLLFGTGSGVVPAGGGQAVSPAVDARGGLSRPDWLLARQLARETALAIGKGGGAPGYLLKRRWAGQACPTCGAGGGGGSTRPDCPTCLGTGVRCGYHPPVGCVWVDLMGGRWDRRPDPAGRRPAGHDDPLAARGVLAPLMEGEDVWVHAVTDDRYVVRDLAVTARVGGVPVLGRWTLQLLPDTHPVYLVPVPKRPSPGAASGLALLGAAPTLVS